MVNLVEGGRRLSVVGMMALKGSAAIAALMLTVGGICTYTRVLHAPLFILFPALIGMALSYSIWLAMLGAALLVVGWIVSGFGSPDVADGDKALRS